MDRIDTYRITHQNIENCQVGDKVYQPKRYDWQRPLIQAITKITKTQITLDNGQRLNRRTGLVLGKDTPWEKYDYRFYRYTPEVAEILEKDQAEVERRKQNEARIRALKERFAKLNAFNDDIENVLAALEAVLPV